MSRVPFPETPIDLAVKYLAERGIEREDMEPFGLEVRGTAECLFAIGQPKLKTPYSYGIVIPFTGGYNHVQWLGEPSAHPPENGFTERTDWDEKDLIPKRGPAGEKGVTVFMPQESILDDSGILYICESAIKTMVMIKNGYRAIGGNGVSTIRMNRGWAGNFPSDMLESGLVKKVVVIFDADQVANTQVQAAIHILMKALTEEFVDLKVVNKVLPKDEELGDKYGLDDFYVAYGADKLHEFIADESNEGPSPVDKLEAHLVELNTRYVITHKPPMIMDRVHRTHVSRADFIGILESHRCYMGSVGKGGLKEVSPADRWLKDPDHHQKELLLYRPGEEEFGEYEGQTFYNTYYDDSVVGVEGDVQPFLDLMANAVPCDIERQLGLESIAWMVQNPTKRLEKIIAMVGEQGTGKSLLAHLVLDMFGDSNTASISPDNFTNNFNSSIIGKKAIVLDDVHKIPRKNHGHIKNFATSKTLMAEFKGKDTFKVEATAVLIVTTNNADALPTEKNDRRLFVMEFNPTIKYEQGDVYWEEYFAWQEGGGVAIIKWFFENLDLNGEVDSTGRVITPPYNPNFMPPMTAIKEHMEDSTRSIYDLFYDGLVYDPESVLRGNKRSFYTMDELAEIMLGCRVWQQLEIREQQEHIKKLGYAFRSGSKIKKVGSDAITTVHGRKRYWQICTHTGAYVQAYVQGCVQNSAVQHDVKRYPNLVDDTV